MTDRPADGIDAPSGWPGVSVVVPVLDEEAHLRAAVSTVLGQDYPGDLEVVLALGPSRDRTDEIAAELAAADDRVRLVQNPSGATGTGLNLALAASRHEVVVRLDGHALVPADYVRVAVETLRRTGADNVGGLMAAEGVTDFQRAVAAAMTSPFGVGQASFHTGGEEGPALTVYLGAFRREVLDRLGGYDESFLRAQDWELNHRIRSSGGVVWFTPRLTVSYRPRSSVRALARQYRDYGRWRRVVMREHEGTASLRYLAPPAAVVAVTVGTVVGLAGWRPGSAGSGGLRRWCAGRLRDRRSRAAGAVQGLAAAGARHHARRVGRRLPHQPARTAGTAVGTSFRTSASTPAATSSLAATGSGHQASTSSPASCAVATLSRAGRCTGPGSSRFGPNDPRCAATTSRPSPAAVATACRSGKSIQEISPYAGAGTRSRRPSSAAGSNDVTSSGRRPASRSSSGRQQCRGAAGRRVDGVLEDRLDVEVHRDAGRQGVQQLVQADDAGGLGLGPGGVDQEPAVRAGPGCGARPASRRRSGSRSTSSQSTPASSAASIEPTVFSRCPSTAPLPRPRWPTSDGRPVKTGEVRIRTGRYRPGVVPPVVAAGGEGRT